MKLRRSIAVRASAKINLELRVLGTRHDGYHELRTLFQSIDLHDTLAFFPSRQFSILGGPHEMPRDESNLIWRAASALAREAGVPANRFATTVRVIKRIPLGSGLGGGSSNAAATLRALVKLWNVEIEPRALGRIARDLGADVPFFLSGGTALGLDRGDSIYELVDLPRYWVLLAVPSFSISTPDAYGWYDADLQPRRIPGTSVDRADGWPVALPELRNDLETPVLSRFPVLTRMRQAVAKSGAVIARLSGSGSVIVGLFKSRADVARARARLKDQPCQILLARTLTRSEHRLWCRPKERGPACW